MKKVLFTQKNNYPHWVGDGFPVRTIFSYNDIARDISPFLLMDYAGPTEFAPFEDPEHRRGVESHPHRGFETVTIVYNGQVEHRDSAGGGGVIQAGDVQWMTAASGLVHEEKHGKEFSKTGGPFEMVQLWVNLPQKDKMAKPRYQGLKSQEIPVVELENGAGTLRIIAGEFQQTTGPAKTFSPINMWDLRLKAGSELSLQVPEGQTTTLFVLSGQLATDSRTISEAELAVFERDGNVIRLKIEADSKVLFLGGAPLNEPIVGYGPFVMNTKAEILQAFEDYEAGKMGVIGPVEGSD